MSEISPIACLQSAKEKLINLELTPETQSKIVPILEELYFKCRAYQPKRNRRLKLRLEYHRTTPDHLILDPFKYKAARFLTKERRTQWCAILVADCTKFKHINDTYGHSVGDKVLATIARTFKKHTRSRGNFNLSCRWGGDEFLYLMTGLSSPEVAMAMAARACLEIELYPWRKEFGCDRVRVDAGIACFNTGKVGAVASPIYAMAIVENMINKADIGMLSLKDGAESDFEGISLVIVDDTECNFTLPERTAADEPIALAATN